MNIAILTARGGSKRIPRKNIRLFMGKPMIAWPIEAAKASGLFERILVSTDDEEIATISRHYGAQVPFMRSAALADDFTHADKAALNMLEWALNEYKDIPFFAHIYPTSPMLMAKDIHMGYEMMLKGKKFVYTAQKLNFPIYQTVMLNEEQEIISLFPPEKVHLRSQDMPQAYIDAGQLYWYNTEAFLEKGINIDIDTGIIIIESERAIDIDTEKDWLQAEKLATLIM